MLICKNCDFNFALKKCNQCLNDESSIFCLDCSVLHSKLKCFRGHTYTEIVVQKTRICSNCECLDATFRCNNCLEPENYFCHGK